MSSKRFLRAYYRGSVGGERAVRGGVEEVLVSAFATDLLYAAIQGERPKEVGRESFAPEVAVDQKQIGNVRHAERVSAVGPWGRRQGPSAADHRHRRDINTRLQTDSERVPRGQKHGKTQHISRLKLWKGASVE